jgi:protein SCO1/2
MSGDNLGVKGGPPKGRILAIALAAAVGLGLGGGAFLFRTTQPSTAASGAGGGAALVGGPFRLVNAQGAPVDERLLRGKWSAVFFGYTYCPDVCPATLQTLQAASEQLGPEGKDLQVVLISVDPARDTPEALRSYLSSFRFPGGVHGLTGAPAQVDGAVKAFRGYAARRGEGSDYLMDHTSTIYLMDPQGRFARPLGGGMDPKQMAEQIRSAMSA